MHGPDGNQVGGESSRASDQLGHVRTSGDGLFLSLLQDHDQSRSQYGISETVDRGNDKGIAADLPIRLLPSTRGEEVEGEVDVGMSVGTHANVCWSSECK